MKRAFLLFGVLFLLAAEDDANKRDLEKMQGDWACGSMVVDGAKSSDDEAQSLFRTIKGSTYTVYLFSKPVGRYTFKLDAGKRPKTIDVTATGAGGAAKQMQGIYEIDGDRWTICLGAPGKDRPNEFRSEEGSGTQLSVWEREHKTK